MTESAADRLRRHVVDPLKRRFVGRDEVIDLIALAVVAGEHLFLLRPAGHGQVGARPPVRRGGARPLLRVPADALLRAERDVRPDRPRPAARGDGRHGHHRHAAGGRVRLPRRAVQRQQRHPEQPADGAQRARLPPRGRDAPAAAASSVRGVEPPAGGRRPAGAVRPLPAPLPGRAAAAGSAAEPAGRRAGRSSATANSARSPTRRPPTTCASWPAAVVPWT